MAEALIDGLQSMYISKIPPKFSILPPEIRNNIWELIHQNIEPRLVTLYYNVCKGFSSKTTPPATLFINKESRHEAKKLFTAAFTSHYPFDTEFLLGFFDYTPVHNLTPLYVDFSKDIICLQEAQGDDITIAFEAMSSEDRQSIQKVAVNIDAWFPSRACMRDQLSALAALSQLRCLFTIRVDAWLAWCSLTEQEMKHALLRDHSIRGCWQYPRSTGSAREWNVQRVVHIGEFELVTMGGVHKERAEQPELATKYKAGRRHLLKADENGVVRESPDHGFWIYQVGGES
jgi:hypothetical protein